MKSTQSWHQLIEDFKSSGRPFNRNNQPIVVLLDLNPKRSIDRFLGYYVIT